MMQTTLNIDEAIVERLHTEAKRRGTTASALAEAGILHILGDSPKPAPKKNADEPLPKLPTWNFGEMLVDIANREELYRMMDDDGEYALPDLPKLPTAPMPTDTCNKEELRRMVEEYLGEPMPETAEELFEKLPKWNSGGELVDIANREELYRVMDEDDGFRY